MKTLQIEFDKKEHPIKNLEKVFINQDLDFSECLGKRMIPIAELHEKCHLSLESKKSDLVKLSFSKSMKFCCGF